MFPKIGVPQNGWCIWKTPIKMDDLGGTIIFGNTHIQVLTVCLDIHSGGSNLMAIQCLKNPAEGWLYVYI